MSKRESHDGHQNIYVKQFKEITTTLYNCESRILK